MKRFSITSHGELPAIVSELVNTFNNAPANKDNFNILDHEITNIVCDLRIAHGNTCASDFSGWLCNLPDKPRFSVTITRK